MVDYDKSEVKEQLSIEDIYQLLFEWGGEPKYTNFGIISATICHNEPGVGSKKLYYYENSGLFICYTGCPEGRFDIFELVRKVASIQWNQELDLNAAVRWIANRFGLAGKVIEKEENSLEDWKIFSQYEKLKEEETTKQNIVLPEFDNAILTRFNYTVKIQPWLKDGITTDVMEKACIGYYPGMDQITIPHFDDNNRFVGLRGRTLIKEDAERFGKYRPMRVNNKLYNHPLGFALYGLNWNKENIHNIQKAIVVEGEKSVLQYASYFGWDNNICVACCGSSISAYQMNLLIESGAKEIIVGFDRQFQELGDEEFKHLTRNLTKINEKYGGLVDISFIFDKKKITNYKDSPLDNGPDVFLKLFKERVRL